VNPRDAKRILRWYPAGWRRRYGEELIAMLDDTHGEWASVARPDISRPIGVY
jgi:hypothetical protein